MKALSTNLVVFEAKKSRFSFATCTKCSIFATSNVSYNVSYHEYQEII